MSGMQRATPREAIGRVATIDVVRGLVVVAVVFNHAVDGVVGAGLLATSHPIAEVNAALYLFRMPALAFVLGVFIPRGIAKAGTKTYVRDRTRTMLYLYLVWFVVQGGVELAAGQLKNDPLEPARLLMVWSPIGQLWFLPFVVVAVVLLALLRPWEGRPGRVTALLLGLAVLSIVAWTWNPPVVGLRGMSLLFFAGVGSVVGLRRLSALLGASVRAWMVVGAVATASFVLLLRHDLVPGTKHLNASTAQEALSFLAAALGILAVLALGVLLTRLPDPARRALAYTGRRTLPIYLAHLIVVGGVRVALERAGAERPDVMLVSAVVLGVTIPLLLDRMSRDNALLRAAFEPPPPRRHSRTAPDGERRTVSWRRPRARAVVRPGTARAPRG